MPTDSMFERSRRSRTGLFAFIIIVLIIIGALLWIFRNSPALSGFLGSNKSGQQPISTVMYACDGGKTITASYYAGEPAAPATPGQPPQPTGTVELTLSDGRTLTLSQTISASGIRYANSDETFVFWSKGNTAFTEEGDTHVAHPNMTYSGCIATAPDPTGALPQVYVDKTVGFSVRYPANYRLKTDYSYNEFGPDKQPIVGVKFLIPTSMATGTNLSSYDTGVSVESLPATKNCTADLFLYAPMGTSTLVVGDTQYSVASSTGAGAGNLYEETVYAVPGTNPCIGVRYFIHSTQIGNYPAGTVKAFDKQALLAQFDQIRNSLVIGQ